MERQKEQQQEQELVLLLRNADEKAFRAIFDLHQPKLYLYCLKHLESSEEAEEMVQDIFIKLWENRETLDPNSHLGAWFHTLAKNKLINHWKRTSLSASYLKRKRLSAEEASNQTENSIDFANYLELTNAAIAKLPTQRQLIFRMSRQEDLSSQEIANSLGISKHTVKSQLVKALKYLRASFDKDAPLPSLLWLLVWQLHLST